MQKHIKFAEVDVTTDNIRNKINNCLIDNWVTNGLVVKEVEKKCQRIFEHKYVSVVNSGTTADLLAALSLYDVVDAVPRQSEIIVPALGFISAINACWMANFNLKFCDIKRETLNIDESKIEKLITPYTKAILAINTMGRPCNMPQIRAICNEHKLVLISDNCEGHLCEYDKKTMGEWADLTTYSAYSAHLFFGAELGLVGTNDKRYYDSVMSNRSHGRPHGSLLFEHESIGWNGKPTDLHASIATNTLDDIHIIFDNRTQNLKYLLDGLSSLRDIFHFSPETNGPYQCSPHAISLTFKVDDELRFQKFCGYLYGQGLEYKLNFKSVPTQQRAYTRLVNNPHKLGDFPEAEFVGRNGLHLACHQFLDQNDLNYMIDSIKGFFK